MRDDSEAPRKKLTRRRFLSTAGSSAAAAALIGRATAAGATERGSPGAVADAPGVEGAVPVTLRINGKEKRLFVDPRTTLLATLLIRGAHFCEYLVFAGV